MILAAILIAIAVFMYLLVLGAGAQNDRKSDDLEQMKFIREYREKRNRQPEKEGRR